MHANIGVISILKLFVVMDPQGYSILHSTLPLLQMHIDELRCESATRLWQNHHSPGKAHAMGSCGTADGAILLKELLGHGLATRTLNMNTWLFLLLVCMCVPVKQWPRTGRASGPSALLFVSLAAVSASNTGHWQESKPLKHMLWALAHRCGNVLFLLKELLGHGLATRTLNMNSWLFLLVLVCLSSRACGPPQLCCLHIFAAAAANISETRHDASSQGQSQWVSLPLVGARTITLGAKALLWNHISEACKRNQPVSCQDNDCTWAMCFLGV